MAWKHWRNVFAQGRTAKRAIEVLAGMLFAVSRQKTVTASILARGLGQRKTWAPDYSLFQEAVWKEEGLFRGVLESVLPLLRAEDPVVLAIDDTCLPKSGVKSPKANSKRKGAPGLGRWCHDALAPKWNALPLKWGHQMVHGCIVVPTRINGRAAGITVAFEPVLDCPKELKKKRPKKTEKPTSQNADPNKADSTETPRRRGRPSKADMALRAEVAATTPARPPKCTEIAVTIIRRVRRWLDEAGLKDRLLVVVGDGSFTNATIILNLPDRTSYVGRTRPDCVLHLPGHERPDGTCTYGEKLQDLRKVNRDPIFTSSTSEYFAGGDRRVLKTKVIDRVYRPTSVRKTPLKALLLVPLLYGPMEDRNYSHEAFLLTTDFETPIEILIQAYLDRWSIEVTHKDMKFHVGVGEAQVSTPQSIRRTHAALAAAWALLQVVTLMTCGEARTKEVFGGLPRWQESNREYRKAKRVAEGKTAPVSRPTAPDILGLFRRGFGVAWTKRDVPFRF